MVEIFATTYFFILIMILILILILNIKRQKCIIQQKIPTYQLYDYDVDNFNINRKTTSSIN